MHLYFTGLLFGLIFIFSLGPGFFAMVQTSVQKGFKKAIFIAIGISLSDMVYVGLALMGVASLLEDEHIRMWMGIAGTIVLIAYGIYSWFKQPLVYTNTVEEKKEISYLKCVVKGFVLNGFNPFIVVFWIGIISFVAVKYDTDALQQIFFFAGVITTIFLTDVMKAFVSYRLRSVITPKSILLLNRSIGVVLILFGLQMIYFLVDNYWM